MRGLTNKERREFFNEMGFTVSNMPLERSEEICFKIIDMIPPEKELETFQEENDYVSKIIELTFGISEADSKN